MAMTTKTTTTTMMATATAQPSTATVMKAVASGTAVALKAIAWKTFSIAKTATKRTMQAAFIISVTVYTIHKITDARNKRRMQKRDALAWRALILKRQREAAAANPPHGMRRHGSSRVLSPHSTDARRAMHRAAYFNLIDICEALHAANAANVHERDGQGRTALDYASAAGAQDAIRFLLEAGVDIHAMDRKGETALHAATYYNRVEVIRLLLEFGAFVDAAGLGTVIDHRHHAPGSWSRMWRRKTPLHCAVIDGHFQAARVLIDAGADVMARDADRMTPMHHAARLDHCQLLHLLWETGADVDLKDRFGNTPLHHAVKGGHETAVITLLCGGADINATNRSGKTVMHVAASAHEGQSPERLKVLRLLLDTVVEGPTETALL